MADKTKFAASIREHNLAPVCACCEATGLTDGLILTMDKQPTVVVCRPCGRGIAWALERVWHEEEFDDV